MTSPKICPTCKREKCDSKPCLGWKCHNSCLPAEKEADEMKVAEETILPFTNDHNEVVRWLRGQDPYEVAEALIAALHEAKAQGRREEREELRKLVEEYPWDIKNKGEVLALFAGHSRASDTIKD